MVMVVGNPTRTALHNDPLPDGPLTERQRSLCDAVRYCRDLADFTAVQTERETSITVASIPYGMPHDAAALLIRRGLAEARAQLDNLERVLAAYGPSAFSPQPYGVPSRGIAGDTRHDVLVAMLRRVGEDLLIRVGDTPVERNPEGGGYRLRSESSGEATIPTD